MQRWRQSDRTDLGRPVVGRTELDPGAVLRLVLRPVVRTRGGGHQCAGQPGGFDQRRPVACHPVQLITSTARPFNPVASTGETAPDGSVVYGAERADGLGGRYQINVNVNPKDRSLIAINCTSPVGTVDAVRDVCINLKHSGSNPTTARAWVIAATKKIPAGNTTIRIRDEDLNGLHWVAYLDETGKNLTVGVSTRHLDV